MASVKYKVYYVRKNEPLCRILELQTGDTYVYCILHIA